MIFLILVEGIGNRGLVMVDIEGRLVWVQGRGSRRGGQHLSCRGWTCYYWE